MTVCVTKKFKMSQAKIMAFCNFRFDNVFKSLLISYSRDMRDLGT